MVGRVPDLVRSSDPAYLVSLLGTAARHKAVPDHSVLSKARRRWGREVFERLFVRTVEQCVAAGLVSGDKLHVDASLIAANASKESVVKSSPELITAYAAAYQAQEKKLNDPADRPCFEAVNDRAISTTDPDAGLVSRGGHGSHPAYHHHRAVDDAQGVITAVERTSGSIAENKKLLCLMDQHQRNTGCQVRTVVADHKYGTAENFVACHEQGVVTHLLTPRDRNNLRLERIWSKRRRASRSY